MKSKYLLLILVLFVFYGCNQKNSNFVINVDSKIDFDTLYISELTTNNSLAKIYDFQGIRRVELGLPTVASIHTKNKSSQYLTILAQNKDLDIYISPDTIIRTNNMADSLVNYLWKSNLEFINDNTSFIFNKKNTDSIPILFESFRQKREKVINLYRDEFSAEIADILHFQNDARIYSFLFWLGRISKVLDAKNSFFDFIGDIPKASETLKSLPDIYLYKYEIEYLRTHEGIESTTDFLKFIEEKTENKDLADFLKAIYIKALIEMPSYWEKHEKLFNSEVLTQTLNAEKSNIYYNIIEQPSSSFFASQNGELAYPFQAEDKFGNQFDLKGSIGKVIFIDTWATWCGPCINHRAKVLELSEKYRNNEEVEILLVSVDSSRDKWISFLKEENKNFAQNLFIENGMRTEFGNNYNIKSIPRYILIGKNGKIINSNFKEPSKAVEKEIEIALME
ncbi:TlpA family protein disulfide reductase [Maribacter cobaltidurans]|uniref:Uncharacterized protein n=1 Tax=Maribacter cobaltidurans TaxID=1178778 RepID=A0A223V4R1_9FLAO|nr:TlpA disulfide reductase family protein [Maribacter cobaltidurans]ASV30373.1 hypothetical protein CJ263_09195 [Maribacter cobaltidurans]GGD78081.1 hypothetical protein GCM10011412_14860 [Maribacter cobaltidurans]